MTPMESTTAVRKAWWTVRLTFSLSPAPAKRATRMPIPVNSDETKTMMTR